MERERRLKREKVRHSILRRRLTTHLNRFSQAEQQFAVISQGFKDDSLMELALYKTGKFGVRVIHKENTDEYNLGFMPKHTLLLKHHLNVLDQLPVTGESVDEYIRNNEESL